MKKVLRKSLSALMAVAILAALMPFTAGCAEKERVIGISNGYVGNNYRNQMLEDVRTAFERYREQGLVDKLIIKNAGLDIDNQINQIRSLIEMDVDLIMIDPNDGNKLNGVIEEAYKKGIPVISFDQPVTSPYAINVIINQQLWGEKLAEWICARLGGKGSIVMMQGLQGHSANEERVAGMNRVLARYQNIEIVARPYGTWDEQNAQKVMTEIIHSYPKLDGVLTQDGMALGIAKAYAMAGMKPPVMTGELFIGYMRIWKELKDKYGFESFAMNNPPGISVTALGIGVRLISGKKLKQELGNTFYYPVRDIITNQNFEDYYEKYKDSPGSSFVDEWLNEAELDALFK